MYITCCDSSFNSVYQPSFDPGKCELGNGLSDELQQVKQGLQWDMHVVDKGPGTSPGNLQ